MVLWVGRAVNSDESFKTIVVLVQVVGQAGVINRARGFWLEVGDLSETHLDRHRVFDENCYCSAFGYSR